MKTTALFASFLLLLSMGLQLGAQERKFRPAPTCNDLTWSDEARQAYPDIDLLCRGVYERNGIYYAKALIEVSGVLGNKISFHVLHRDGTKGPLRGVRVSVNWTATLDGKTYRASELNRGQQLNIYLPEGRFALVFGRRVSTDSEQALTIE